MSFKVFHLAATCPSCMVVLEALVAHLPPSVRMCWVEKRWLKEHANDLRYVRCRQIPVQSRLAFHQFLLRRADKHGRIDHSRIRDWGMKTRTKCSTFLYMLVFYLQWWFTPIYPFPYNAELGFNPLLMDQPGCRKCSAWSSREVVENYIMLSEDVWVWEHTMKW